MSKRVMDADYFIRKFEAIPEESWCVANFRDGEKRCAYGHCGADGIDETRESRVLFAIFERGQVLVTSTNDGHHPRFQQPTPKQRILAALREIKSKQEQTL